ncbi:hypothetical protein CSOJ01_06398 [Colletotrichum sojae]|uniref:Uncharacterized protein n=1 Tax=Colletotrichum sojae TaxID=2175907 RepID=A0A8H6JC24_9PEZI|nr:hypothetical protein CSOJ01_06398 [Colletotrichum sojae]
MEPSIFSPLEPTNTSIYRQELPIDHDSHMDSSSSVYSNSPIDNDSPMTPLPSSSPWDGGPKPMEMDSPAIAPSPSSSSWYGGPKLMDMDMDAPADEPWTPDFSTTTLLPLTLSIPKSTVAPASEINEPLPSTTNPWPTLGIFARGTAAPAGESDEPLPSTRNQWPPEGEIGESSSVGTSVSMKSSPHNSFCSSAPTVPCDRDRWGSRFWEDLEGAMGGSGAKPGMPSPSGNEVTMGGVGQSLGGRRDRGSPEASRKPIKTEFEDVNWSQGRSSPGTLDPSLSPRSKHSNAPPRRSYVDRAQGISKESRARANLRQRFLDIREKASDKWRMLRRLGRRDKKGERRMTDKDEAAAEKKQGAAAEKEEKKKQMLKQGTGGMSTSGASGFDTAWWPYTGFGESGGGGTR